MIVTALMVKAAQRPFGKAGQQDQAGERWACVSAAMAAFTR